MACFSSTIASAVTLENDEVSSWTEQSRLECSLLQVFPPPPISHSLFAALEVCMESFG